MATAKTETAQTEDLMAQIAQLRTDFSTLAKEFKSLSETKAENMAGRAGERVVNLKAAGEHKMEQAGQAARDVAAEAEGFVKAHPTSTIAASAAIGFLIGTLTARR